MTKSFGAESTTDDVLEGVDLSGKRILVTGVSSGLGVETARALVAHGATVVGAARDLNKARKATEAIGNNLQLVELDLASLKSVRASTDALLAKGDKFDVVITNAGVMACPFGLTEDGFETQFGTNHLGHFLFVNRIISLFKPMSRLVNLASSGHRFADTDLDDPNFEHTAYSEFFAYGRSKTANIQFALEFDRRHKAAGIRATAVHPGVITTELSRHMTPELRQRMGQSMSHVASTIKMKTIPQGAATSVWAGMVAAPDIVGGLYCEDCHVAAIDDGDGFHGVKTYALDQTHAQALWTKSEKMVGEQF